MKDLPFRRDARLSGKLCETLWQRFSPLAFAVVSLALSACSKDSSTGVHVGLPASMSIVSGDAQSGVVGRELVAPLVVRVTDANGNPVQGQAVNFRVTGGGGSVFAGTSNTNADGLAQERWTLGTVAGADQTVEARAVDNTTGDALVFATFHAATVADAPAALKLSTQPVATAQSGLPLTAQPAIQLVDQYGNVVARAGVQVTASISAPNSGHMLGGTATASTDNMGVASFTNLAILGTAGPVTLSFAAPGLTSVTSSTITLTAGAPTQLAAVGQTSFTGTVGASLAILPRVVVRDAAGNSVAGVAVIFTVSNDGGAIAPTSAVTDANGEAALTNWTLPKQAGSAIVIASASAIPNSTVTFTATASVGTASHILRADDTVLEGQVGTTIPVALRVTDDFGNAVAGATVNLTVGVNSGAVSAAGGPSGSTATGTSDASGSLTVSWTLSTAAGQQMLTLSLAGGPSLTVQATARAGAAAVVALDRAPSAAAASGAVFAVQPIAVLHDQYGNVVAQSGIIVTASVVSPYSLIGTATATTDASGRAGFSGLAISGPSGPAVLTFASPSLTAATATVQLGAGSPATLTIFAGDNQDGIVSKPLTNPLVAKLADQAGNPVAGVVINWTTPDGGTLNPTQSTTNSNGEASSALTLGSTPGTNHVVAGLATNANVQVTFTATAARPAPAHLTVVTPPSASATVGTALPVVVAVTDANNAAIAGISVTFASVLGGGSFTPSSAVTDANGHAPAEWILGTTAGRDSASASVQGLSPLGFGVNALAGSPAHVSYVSGSGQTGTVALPLAQPLVARATDQYGNVVNAVAWRSNSGTLSPIANDASGNVRASWTLTRVGADTAYAVVASDTARFIATGLAAAGPTLTLAAPLQGPFTVARPITVSVVLRDAAGVGVPSTTLNWQITAGGGGFNDISAFQTSVTTAATTTDANGFSSTTWYPGRTVGQNTLTVNGPGASPLTVTLTSVPGSLCSSIIQGASYGATFNGMVGTLLPYVLTPVGSDPYGNVIPGAGPGGFGVPNGGTLITMPDRTYRIKLGTVAGTAMSTYTAISCQFNGSYFFGRDQIQVLYFTTTPGPATSIAVGNGDGQTGVAGSRLSAPLTVNLRDQYGNAATADVTWVATSGGGTISASGISASWTLGTASAQQTATATVANVGTVTFHATAVAGPPAQMTKVSGDAQTAPAGSALPAPLIVQLTDQYGNPTSGVTVTWIIASGGGTITSSAVTDTNGHASAQWTLGNTPGANSATATVNGTALSVTFSATGS